MMALSYIGRQVKSRDVTFHPRDCLLQFKGRGVARANYSNPRTGIESERVGMAEHAKSMLQ
jgi:hypothetical protein